MANATILSATSAVFVFGLEWAVLKEPFLWPKLAAAAPIIVEVDSVTVGQLYLLLSTFSLLRFAEMFQAPLVTGLNPIHVIVLYCIYMLLYCICWGLV